MATHYQHGRAFEYRIKKDLEGRGYYCVRAAGSHSKIDVAAIKGEVAAFVQCKADGNISPQEWATLYEVCKAPNFLPVVASKTTSGKIAYHLIDTPRKPRRTKWVVFDPGEA